MSQEFHQWRPNWIGNNKNRQRDFEEYLMSVGADIFAKNQRWSLKFRIGNEVGFLYKTGYCCPVFRKYLKNFKRMVMV